MSDLRELSSAKQALLAQRLRGSGTRRQRDAIISRRPVRDSAPLSFPQRQVWVIDQMTPGNPAYHLPYAFRLRGPLDADALDASVNAVIRRHEVLRTTFAIENGEPVQRIHPELRIAIETTCLDDVPIEEREVRLHALATATALRPFDLARLPLLRVSLFRLAGDEHVLLVNMHHIVSDGLSVAYFLQELDICYRAFVAGTQPELPALAVQYGDFAAWQREALAGNPETVRQIDFWRSRLEGAPATLELPTDRSRPTTQSFAGSNVFFDLPADLISRLRDLGASERCTMYTTLFAAYQALLCRYAGAEDFVVGSPVAGRGPSEVERLIGNFLTVTALRCDLSGDPSFREVLRRTRDTVLGALSNASVPLEMVVQHLHIERTPDRNPVFQVLFQLLSIPSPRLGTLRVSPFMFDLGYAQLDLSLHIYETSDACVGRFEYCSDLFERATVERMAANFEELLRAAVADPDTAVSRLRILTATERDRLVRDWNATAADCPAETLPALLAASVAAHPDRTAVRCDGRAVTYAALDARAAALAAALAACGAGPGQRIGLCLERSEDMLAAVLGVLKTGAAYVPLDPGFPEARLRFMAEDAQLAWLVSTTPLAERTGVPRARQLLLDADAATIAAAATCVTDAAPAAPAPDDPAYVIYTSGSTGQPKGVVIPHRAVVNLLTDMARRPGLGADDVLVAVTTLSFDISVLELLLPLTVGATVALATRDQAMDGQELQSLLETTGATVMQATPVTWRLLLEAGWRGRRPFKALVGGEVLPPNLADALLARGVELWNMYGPTETTIWSTCARITDATHGITIGRPIANTVVHILDAQQQLCPIGVPGELYIGGAGVALGYWQRPELTAERFVADPLATSNGDRLYRTGDRARWLADGTLEHLGRFDDQVKVRGFRIDVGDVEANLAQHPAVREAAVAVHADDQGNRRLVAYLVPTEPASDPVAVVRESVRTQLPDYMVPSQFVVLDSLPRTQNGKLNRRALQAPAHRGWEPPPTDTVAPRTPTEEMVLRVFRDVLGRTDFGVCDSFFDLGGDSLMAARLVLRLRAAAGSDVPLRVLFERQTVASMSEAVDAILWGAADAGLAACTEGAREVIEI